MSFQTDVLDRVARVVGGTVTNGDAHFFSGDKNADGTGVGGLKGCYSLWPRNVQSTPVAIVAPKSFTAELTGQAKEFNSDELRLILLVAPFDPKAQMAVLTAYRDTIPAAFRSHMWATDASHSDPIPDVIDVWITSGQAGIHNVAGTDYLAWEFVCRVRRELSVTYAT
jgi:hypothetical protein